MSQNTNVNEQALPSQGGHGQQNGQSTQLPPQSVQGSTGEQAFNPPADATAPSEFDNVSRAQTAPYTSDYLPERGSSGAADQEAEHED